MWLVGRLQSVDLRIKWPNDIYFGREMKLGGIIVKSSVMNDVIHVNIGAFLSVCLSVCHTVSHDPADWSSHELWLWRYDFVATLNVYLFHWTRYVIYNCRHSKQTVESDCFCLCTSVDASLRRSITTASMIC